MADHYSMAEDPSWLEKTSPSFQDSSQPISDCQCRHLVTISSVSVFLEEYSCCQCDERLSRTWSKAQLWFELFFWTWFSVLPHAVLHLSACISAYFRVYFRMWKSPKKRVFPHVFPRGNSQIRLQIDMRKFTFPLEFPLVEIHQKMSISARWEIHNFSCISTCGNARSHVNFHMGKSVFPPVRIYTYFCVFLHAVIHLKLCKSVSAEIYFSSCENSH